jgi:hypothetical protein
MIDLETMKELANTTEYVKQGGMTHYEDCKYDHWGCAILALVAEIEHLQKELEQKS